MTSLPIDRRLTAHLRAWLGVWPPAAAVHVVGSPARERPGWDGRVRPALGVNGPAGAVLSVPPATVAAVRALDDPLGPGLAAAVGRPEARVSRGVLRWSQAPAALEPLGEWVARDDPRVPDWLRPFNGDVLIVCDAAGRYLAGAGRKQHTRHGHELAVGTVAHARGRGLARRLVVTAAQRVLADGAVPLYLHDPANTASARVAEAAGFPDRGWSVWSLL